MDFAEYTVKLKTLLEDEKAKQLIDKALSTYPMFEPKNKFEYMVIPSREELNNKLLNHYKYREIGFETPARFIDELEIVMNEIMPYYNGLLKTADVINGIDDVFGNVDIIESFEEETTGSAKGSSSGNSKGDSTTSSEMHDDGKSVDSATPQGQLDISSNDIDSIDYADNAKWNKNNSSSSGEAHDTSETNSESESESSGTTKHTLTKKGNQGVNTYAHDMLEFRQLIRNIEQEIIENPKIQELFMMVY